MIGTRVRLTIHAPDGTAHSAEGSIEALAVNPGQALNPRDPKPWDCLVRLDGTPSVIPYNVVELEILDESEPLDDALIDGLRFRVTELDDENATLQAEIVARNKVIEQLTAERDEARTMVATLSSAVVAAEKAESKIAAATKKGGKS